MTSFSSLLSSISGQTQAPRASTAPNARPTPRPPNPANPQALSNGARLTPNNAVAGVKRKPEESISSPRPKAIRADLNAGPGQSPSQTGQNAPVAKPISSAAAATRPYQGTARSAGSTNPAKAVPKPPPKPGVTAPHGSTTQPAAATAAKPKRGFASLMEKAKAMQQASTVAGPSGIKHKAAEKLSKRDREKMQKEQQQQQQQQQQGKAVQGGRFALTNRSRSGTPMDARPGAQRKGAELAYKGTMKKPTVELAYKGTMRKPGTSVATAKPAAKKGMAQDKYGGYASWSDLDNAEDDEEEGYDSAGTSDMEGGFDDVMQEESRALRVARKEDQEALEEEERLRREKQDRKKRLQALSKDAAARKR